MKPTRMPSETFALDLAAGVGPDGEIVRHRFDVSLAYHGGRLHDIIFVTRGKIGQGLDLMFQDLGIQLSRLIQGREP